MNDDLELLFAEEPPPAHVPSFEEWYARYPKKQGKAAARTRWAKMSAAERASAWIALPGWERYALVAGTQFVPMASTWLNQSRWEDDAPVIERTTGPGMMAVRAGLALSANDRIPIDFRNPFPPKRVDP
jgi:hypothetical protein